MKKARKILLTLCAALLLVTMSVGATLAYLTSKDSVTNTFTTGEVEIYLNEAVVMQDENENYVVNTDATHRVKENNYTMYPGGSYKKDPTIYVTTESEDCYVAAEVVLTTNGDLLDLIPATSNENEKFIGFGELVKDGIFAQTFGTPTEDDNGNLVVENSEWKLVQFPAVGDAENGYTRKFHIFRKTVVAKNDTTKNFVLFDRIEIPENWNNDQVAKLNGMTMDITAYGVQEAGMANCEDAMAKAGYITE